MNRILIIDDEVDMAELCKLALSSVYEVIVISGGSVKNSPLIQATIAKVDLVISDYDGVPFHMIQAECCLLEKPLLLVSGNSEIAAHHPYHLCKPFAKKVLLSSVEELLFGKGIQAA